VDLLLQVYDVLLWAGLLKGLQLALWPRLRPALGDYAYPAAYPASLLLFALATWYCGLLRIPVALALLIFLGLGAYGIRRGEYRLREIRGLLAWDAVFLVGFLFALAVRFVNPPIGYFSEQYMNHAFLASVIREPVVPPLDPWFAGGHLTVYYYLGHWLTGCLAIVTGIPSEVAFNLVPATVYGASFVTLYATGSLLLRRWRWVALPVLLLVPPSVPWFLATGAGLYEALQETNWIVAGARFRVSGLLPLPRERPRLRDGRVQPVPPHLPPRVCVVPVERARHPGPAGPCPPPRGEHRVDAAPLLLGRPRLRAARRRLPSRALSPRAGPLHSHGRRRGPGSRLPPLPPLLPAA
jgi:Uncharacterized membrane protein